MVVTASFWAGAGHCSGIRVQTGSGTHSVSYSVGSMGSSPGVIAAGAWYWPFTQYGDQNKWASKRQVCTVAAVFTEPTGRYEDCKCCVCDAVHRLVKRYHDTHEDVFLWHFLGQYPRQPQILTGFTCWCLVEFYHKKKKPANREIYLRV